MRRKDINEEDQKTMQGLYNSEKKFTYKSISELYKTKYPGISENIVGTLVRERNKSGQPYYGIRDEIRSPINFMEEKINTQKIRRKD